MLAYQLFPTQFQMEQAANDLASHIKYLGLYQNNPSITKGFNPVSITEADFSNYARIDIGSDWAAAVIDVNGDGMCLNIIRTFTKTGATANATIYGLLYFDTAGTEILWAQPFADGPYPMVLDGDLIRITPKIIQTGPAAPCP